MDWSGLAMLRIWQALLYPALLKHRALATINFMDIAVLRTLIDKYFMDNPASRQLGQRTDMKEFDKLDKKVLNNLPDWYRRILIDYPLAGLEIGIPNDFGDEELVGKPMEELPLMGLTFLSVERIEYCTLKLFPDYELIDLNHIRIAEDEFGTQEGIYINSKESDPSVRLIFHDFGETGKEVLKESELLLEKFTDIFRYGKRRDLDSA